MTDTIAKFHDAASNGDIPMIRDILKTGVNINARNKQQRTAILMAAIHQQYDTVQLLIEAGADINLQDETCLNPFLWGCLNNDLILVKMMIQAKTDLTRLTRFGGVGITPAAEKGFVDIVKELLDTTNININHTNFVGWTPLLEAIVLNDGGAHSQEIVELLLKHGANPNMTDMYGKTPLTLANEKGYHAIAQLLITFGGV